MNGMVYGGDNGSCKVKRHRTRSNAYLLHQHLTQDTDEMSGRASTSRQSISMAASSSAVESSLPLQVALTWLVVALYTTNGTRENQVHSATFIASILEIITGEILEV
jgi:hypothetical protein